MQKVVDTKNVHWALRAQSIIAFGLTWIAIVLVKTKNSKHNIQFKLFDFGVIKTAPFWLLIFSSSRVYLGMSSFYTHWQTSPLVWVTPNVKVLMFQPPFKLARV